MTLTAIQVCWLIVLWATYGAIHSVLASNTFKRIVAERFPGMMKSYRLGFNVFAVLLLAPPLWLTFAWGGESLWRWSGVWAWSANGLALAAVVAFFWSVRYYDMGAFSGLAQWRAADGSREDRERLTLSPLHRFVRHPWYALALVILWTRDMDEARLVSTVCISLYLWLGSLLEERKLVIQHGDTYARYRARVNGLFPWPGRILSKREAMALLDDRTRKA